MSFNIGKSDYDQQAVVWETEDKGKYALVKLGTSQKDKQSGEYINSNWSFVKFVGEAHKHIMEVEPKTRIIIKKGLISNASYMKDGQKLYPKYPNIVVFAWDYVNSDSKPKDTDKRKNSADDADEFDEDDIF